MSGLVARLIAAGTPPELIEEVAMLCARAEIDREAIETRRSKDRDRQNARRGHVTSRDTADVTDEIPSLDKSPQTPKINPTPHVHGEGAPTREAAPKLWACPEGVDTAHWRDFRRNRRRKNLTDSETAYLGQLRLLERFANEEWPPGKLVQHSAEKGWGTIVDPSEYETPRNGNRPANDHRNHEAGSPMLAGLQILRSQQPG